METSHPKRGEQNTGFKWCHIKQTKQSFLCKHPKIFIILSGSRIRVGIIRARYYTILAPGSLPTHVYTHYIHRHHIQTHTHAQEFVVLPKSPYRSTVISIRIPALFFTEIEKKFLQRIVKQSVRFTGESNGWTLRTIKLCCHLVVCPWWVSKASFLPSSPTETHNRWLLQT